MKRFVKVKVVICVRSIMPNATHSQHVAESDALRAVRLVLNARSMLSGWSLVSTVQVLLFSFSRNGIWRSHGTAASRHGFGGGCAFCEDLVALSKCCFTIIVQALLI